MSYLCFPHYQPVLENSEFNLTLSVGNPDDNYALWTKEQALRLEKQKRSLEKNVVVDCVCDELVTSAKTSHVADIMSSDLRSARLSLMMERPLFNVFSIIQAPRAVLFDPRFKFKSHARERLAAIESKTHTLITFFDDGLHGAVGTPTDETVSIQILGERESVIIARTAILVLIDEFQGQDIEFFTDIPLRNHYIVAGQNGQNLNRILRESGAKIYLPSPFDYHGRLPSNISEWESGTPQDANTIIITGTMEKIKSAKEMLLKESLSLKQERIELSARKMEWILATRTDYLCSLMRRCGAFIAFPPIGSASCSIQVYASDTRMLGKVNGDLARITCMFHEAKIQINESALLNKLVPSFRKVQFNKELDHENLSRTLYDIANDYGVEIVCTKNSIEVYGVYGAVSSALYSIFRNEYLSWKDLATTISVEIPSKHENFFKGKHDGKIKKLTQGTQASCKIHEGSTRYTKTICLISPARGETLQAYINLNLEFPHEMSMYIPEFYHQMMIGDEGWISRLFGSYYNSYLRYSNKAELQKITGYFKTDHNVFALTPSKFANGFDNLKSDLSDLYCVACTQYATEQYELNPCDMSIQEYLDEMGAPETRIDVFIPVMHMSKILPLLNQLEQLNQVSILIPPLESGSCIFTFVGRLNNIIRSSDQIYGVIEDSAERISTLNEMPCFKHFNTMLFPQVNQKEIKIETQDSNSSSSTQISFESQK